MSQLLRLAQLLLSDLVPTLVQGLDVLLAQGRVHVALLQQLLLAHRARRSHGSDRPAHVTAGDQDLLVTSIEVMAHVEAPTSIPETRRS